MKRFLQMTMVLAAVVALSPAVRAAKTLDIYFIDVEGGQATLVVTPRGESLLIDTGFPSDDALIAPAFGEKPGASANGRDPKRILAAAKDAGLTKIDYLLLTHYHADHGGGAVELSQLMPIRAFVDHGPPAAGADEGVPGTQKIYEGYVGLRAKGRHVLAKPGERLELKGVEVRFVSADGATLGKPLTGAGQPNNACGAGSVPAQEKIENPHSVGIRLRYGSFSFLDVGDLSGDPLFALTCPKNLIGQSDVYLVAHHGGADAAVPSMFDAIKPLVAVFNNGPRKGAQAKTLNLVKQTLRLDGWQLHRSLNEGAENAPEGRIANLDDSTSAWIKVSARDDGSFTVTNGRTGTSKRYKR
ncbi:MAG: MBL fold metallo-hydrolase [Vicinamibacteria bacterium]